MARVRIVSGPIRSGKTTRLAAWASGRADVAGLLSPDGPEGRSFVDVVGGARMAMENPDPDEPVLTVGRFRFRAAAFDWANARLIAAAADPRHASIIVDEVGPLELAHSGLWPSIGAVVGRPAGDAILVVRAHLVRAVSDALALYGTVETHEFGW